MHRIRFLRLLGFLALAAVIGACSDGLAASSPSTTAFATVTTLPARTTTTTTTTPPPPSTTVVESTTTTSTEPPPEPKGRLVINGTGDVNLDPTFVRSFPSTGYEYAWSGLDDVFRQDDLTVVNLECSASDLGTPWDKPATFRCDP